MLSAAVQAMNMALSAQRLEEIRSDPYMPGERLAVRAPPAPMDGTDESHDVGAVAPKESKSCRERYVITKWVERRGPNKIPAHEWLRDIAAATSAAGVSALFYDPRAGVIRLQPVLYLRYW